MSASTLPTVFTLDESDRGALTVRSSSGNGTYRVTYAGPYIRHCECKGFTYRGRCRHVDQLNALLSAAIGGGATR